MLYFATLVLYAATESSVMGGTAVGNHRFPSAFSKEVFGNPSVSALAADGNRLLMIALAATNLQPIVPTTGRRSLMRLRGYM